MLTSECTVAGCDDPPRARGWCNKHYRRWKRTGDPTKAAWERGSPEANFWAKVQRRRPGQCWPWTGATTEDGYGHFISARNTTAHRFSYELHVGEIPDGAQIDHRCHSSHATCMAGSKCPHRRCVNPAHLEAVSREENQRRRRDERGRHLAAQQSAKTHCPQGHLYDEANTYVDKRGSRNCRTCARDRARQSDRSEYQRQYYLARKNRT